MIEDRIQQQIRHRLEWALTDHRDALAKLYALPSLKITSEDRATWIEITSYLANVESHLDNILARVPEVPTIVEEESAIKPPRTGDEWLDAKIYDCHMKGV